METRKIQQVGGGTYTVSLPKGWAEAEGITAGTVVDLHTHIDVLIGVQVRAGEDAPTCGVDVRVDHESAERVERTLRAAYAAGAEEVVLDAATAFTDDQQRVIERVCRDLTGVTVAEASPARASVRTLLDAEEVSIRQSVRQLRFVALAMHRDATAALLGEAPAHGTDRDDQADRLFALIDRHFARGLARLAEVDALGLTRPELFELRTTAHELERVADGAERIATLAGEKEGSVPEPVADEVRPVARAARSVVDDAVDAVVGDAAVEDAHRALDARDRVRVEVDALDRRLFEDEAGDYRLARALDALRRTAERGGTVAELALRAAIRRGELSAPADGDPADHPAPTDG